MQSLVHLGLIVALSMISGPTALAQPPRGMPRYDPSTETRVAGTVQDVIQPQRGRGWYRTGTHLMVKSGDEILDVHLGPSSYISSQGFTFAKGDSVEILGSKVVVDGKNAIIAREVTKDGKKLTLRDSTGRPMWAGRRK